MNEKQNNKHYYTKQGIEQFPCKCGCYHEGTGMNECECPGWTEHRYEETVPTDVCSYHCCPTDSPDCSCE